MIRWILESCVLKLLGSIKELVFCGRGSLSALASRPGSPVLVSNFINAVICCMHSAF